MPRKAQYGPGHEYSPEKYEEWEAIDDKVDRALEQQPSSSLGTGEPVHVYIKTSPGVYEKIGETFGSKIEARQFVEKNYPGYKSKVLYESEAIAEAEKVQRRTEQIQQVKEGIKSGARAIGGKVKQVGKGALDASYHMAKKEGMTREQYEAELRQLQLEEERKRLRKEKMETQMMDTYIHQGGPGESREPREPTPRQPFGPFGQQPPFRGHQGPPRSQEQPKPQPRFRVPGAPYRPPGLKPAHVSLHKGKYMFDPNRKPFKPHFATDKPLRRNQPTQSRKGKKK